MNRILIAEDEPRLASFLEKWLRSNGFVTTVAEDGAKASLMARDDEFDLLACARSSARDRSRRCAGWGIG